MRGGSACDYIRRYRSPTALVLAVCVSMVTAVGRLCRPVTPSVHCPHAELRLHILQRAVLNDCRRHRSSEWLQEVVAIKRK